MSATVAFQGGRVADRVCVRVRDDPPRDLWIGSVADPIFRKLAWHRTGNDVSNREWGRAFAQAQDAQRMIDTNPEGWRDRLKEP